MTEAVNAVIINAKEQILLVRKRAVWILPGGKPLPNEADVICLQRELKEELPGLKQVKVTKYITTLNGTKTPHTHKELRVKVYVVQISPRSEITSAAKIKQAEWVSQPEEYNLSEMTKKIISYLRQKNILASKK